MDDPADYDEDFEATHAEVGDPDPQGLGPDPQGEDQAGLALYRRYRPDTFDEIIGQEHVTAPLQRALDNDRVNHAYLFSGPRGCGKTTSARILARALNCAQGPTATPCGVCQSCRDLATGGPGSIDVIEIDAASHGGVDDARDLRERAFFAPVNSRYKIYIIDEAHMVTTQGFNALLKLVEEPPPHVKFIFATTEPDKVIGTIRSRTHHYPFRLVPPKVLGAYLSGICEAEGIAVEPGVLPLVVRAGGGSVRDSMSVLDQLLGGAEADGVSYHHATGLLGYTPEALLDEMVDAFAAGDGQGVFTVVDRVIEVGQDPRRFAEDLLRRLRDLVIVASVPDAVHTGLVEVTPDRVDSHTRQAEAMGLGELTRAAEVISAGLTQMRGTTAPRLHLELMCARVLLPGADVSERGINARLDRIERRLNLGGLDTGVPVGEVPGQILGEAPAAGTTGRRRGRPRPQTEEAAAATGPAATAPGEAPHPGPAQPEAAQAPPAQPGTAQAPPAHARAYQPETSQEPPAQDPPVQAPPAQPEAAQAPPAHPGSAQAPPRPVRPPQPPREAPPAAVPDQVPPRADQAPSQADQGPPMGVGPQPDRPAPAPDGGHPAQTGDLSATWGRLLEAVGRRRNFTKVLLGNAALHSIHGGVITVALNSPGARAVFERPREQDVFASAVEEVLGSRMQVEMLIDPAAGRGDRRGGPAPGTGERPAPRQQPPSGQPAGPQPPGQQPGGQQPVGQQAAGGYSPPPQSWSGPPSGPPQGPAADRGYRGPGAEPAAAPEQDGWPPVRSAPRPPGPPAAEQAPPTNPAPSNPAPHDPAPPAPAVAEPAPTDSPVRARAAEPGQGPASPASPQQRPIRRRGTRRIEPPEAAPMPDEPPPDPWEEPPPPEEEPPARPSRYQQIAAQQRRETAREEPGNAGADTPESSEDYDDNDQTVGEGYESAGELLTNILGAELILEEEQDIGTVD